MARSSVLAILGLGVLFGPIATGGTGPPNLKTAGPPREAFERFRSLDGVWRGESTKGWKEDVSFKTIAAGSAVKAKLDGAKPGHSTRDNDYPNLRHQLTDSIFQPAP